jgi:hypothetical protein
VTAAVVVVALSAATASATEERPTVLAQRGGDNVTPLRFLTREQIACQDACRARASQCHARAPSPRSKEACENAGIRCSEDCIK